MPSKAPFNKLNKRKIAFDDILPLILELKKDKNFRVRKIGTSVRKTPIYSVTFGNGKRKVLAWTQMHGDEPTATRVFFDFAEFLSLEKNKDFRENLFSQLTIEFIPMLNPDGAEDGTRHNALGIDINRDALLRISPESKILWKEFEKFEPHFALNLHDQDCHHAAGDSREPVWLSFLATVPDGKKIETAARKKSMNIIGKTATELRKSGIKNIARYDDEYEPRAFGDNFVKAGTSVILIEAGCAEKSALKTFERKIFFDAVLSVLKNIAEYEFDEKNLKTYKCLPENKERILDLIVNRVKLPGNFTVSLGIKNGAIEATGDLSVFGAFEFIDAKNLFLEGNFKPGEKADFRLLAKNGETVAEIKKGKIKVF